MRHALGLVGLLGLVSLGGGCAHVDEARARYHEHRADRAAAHGRYQKAAREERKAEAAELDARYDPLP